MLCMQPPGRLSEKPRTHRTQLNNSSTGHLLPTGTATYPTTHYYTEHYRRTRPYNNTSCRKFAQTNTGYISTLKNSQPNSLSNEPHHLTVNHATISTTTPPNNGPTTYRNGKDDGAPRKNEPTHCTSAPTTATKPPPPKKRHKHSTTTGSPNSKKPPRVLHSPPNTYYHMYNASTNNTTT